MNACLDGGGLDCTVLTWFQNGCGALAVDQYGMAQGKGARSLEPGRSACPANLRGRRRSRLRRGGIAVRQPGRAAGHVVGAARASSRCRKKYPLRQPEHRTGIGRQPTRRKTRDLRARSACGCSRALPRWGSTPVRRTACSDRAHGQRSGSGSRRRAWRQRATCRARKRRVLASAGAEFREQTGVPGNGGVCRVEDSPGVTRSEVRGADVGRQADSSEGAVSVVSFVDAHPVRRDRPVVRVHVLDLRAQ